MAFIILLLSLCFELLSLSLFLKYYPHFPGFAPSFIFSSHLAAALASGLAIYSLGGEKKKMAHFSFTLLLTIPIAGYIGIMLFFRRANPSKTHSLFEEFRKHISSVSVKEEITASKLKKSLKHLRESYAIEPLSGLLCDAPPEQKLGIIKSLGRIPGRDTVGALRDLLHDSHMDVRYYAGEEIAKIAERYSILISEMKKKHDEDRSNPGFLCELGSLHLRHALSGLFEDNREELLAAKEALEKSLKLKRDQFDAQFLMGRVFQFLGSPESAIGSLESAIELDGENPPAILAITECYWEKRDFQKLKKYIEMLEKHKADFEGDERFAVREFLESWKQGGEAPD